MRRTFASLSLLSLSRVSPEFLLTCCRICRGERLHSGAECSHEVDINGCIYTPDVSGDLRDEDEGLGKSKSCKIYPRTYTRERGFFFARRRAPSARSFERRKRREGRSCAERSCSRSSIIENRAFGSVCSKKKTKENKQKKYVNVKGRVRLSTSQ